MEHYARPENVTRGQLLWLELREFPDRPMVAVEVTRVFSNLRTEVEILASNRALITVPTDRLYERIQPPDSRLYGRL